ncbi:uncharacterized protein LOC125494691 [Beta vulgaris subsp. vulgaris]|uniref:uncharacterized protein LOC125494691 n=1 Tax=Beta vulgaris subsp. vulgaris TaxID=3555 RepID=UPI0020372026|nr:uncharacterized protein LOC125494691 [Beta vulgaris subsp. vulgaris]
MSCITWNVRGMNDPFKIKEIKSFLYNHKVAVCALLETRVREQNANKVQGKFGKDWKWLNNYSHSARGRIWIGWRPAWVNVTLTHTQEQMMVCDIQDQSYKIKMVAVYGLHTIADRKSLWSGLLQCVQQQEPMIVIGDFNAVCHSNDRLNGTLITDAETEDFQQFLLQSNLIESRSTGPYYSWSNSSIGSDRVLSRIDKAYVNLVWLGMYTEVSVQYLPPGISDHSPLLFTLMTGRSQGGKPFKFMNVMAKQDEFIETVEKAWSSINGRYKLQAVWLKLKAVKRE